MQTDNCYVQIAISRKEPVFEHFKRNGHITNSQGVQKPMKNADIAKVFSDIADLLEMKGENKF